MSPIPDGFPRDLSPFELAALEILLPSDRPGYDRARQFAARSRAIGEGRWGVGDLILAPISTPIDVTKGMTPVVAYGELTAMNAEGEHLITVGIHTEEDEQMEVQFTSDGPLVSLSDAVILAAWTYSSWSPGDRCPATGGAVREIKLAPPSGKNAQLPAIYILAISPEKRTLWLYDTRARFNQLLPVTGFYEYLLRSHPPTDKKASLTARYLFEHLEEFSDEMLLKALLHYNSENPKFDASLLQQQVVAKKRNLSQLLQGFLGKKP